MSQLKADYTDRANRIMTGQTDGYVDSAMDKHDDLLANAFFKYLALKDIPIKPLDEAMLKETADRVEYLARSQNVYAGYFFLDRDWHKGDIGDFIGIEEGSDKPFILIRKRDAYAVIDPESDEERTYDPNTLSISDQALFIHDLADENIDSGRKLIFKAFFKEKREAGIFIRLTVIGALLALIIPMFVGVIVDEYIPLLGSHSIIVMSAVMIFVIATSLLINIVINMSRIRMQTRIRQSVIVTFFNRLMALGAGDEGKIADKLMGTFFTFINSIDMIVEAFLGIVIYSMQVIAILFSFMTYKGGRHVSIYIYMGLMILVSFVFQFILGKITEGQRNAESDLTRIRTEILDNIEAIKNNGMEDRSYYRFAVAYDANMKLMIKKNVVSQYQNVLFSLGSSLGVLIIFLIVVARNFTDTGVITSMVSSVSLLVGYMTMLVTSISSAVTNMPYLKLLDEVLQFPYEEKNSNGATNVIKGDIELSNVFFSYSPTGAPIINNMSLKIKAGEYIGIVGSSGCGKSTLVKLLLGFVKPTHGVVSYDGIDIKQYDIKALRRQFGVVMQNAQIVSGNILMNIGMSENADMDKVDAAAKAANIYDDIMNMPMKYNTMLSSEADLISGGQRQRIVLARALMNEPRVLILDEATSAMDNRSQAIVKKSMDAMKITRIVIAHRLSTIQDCDRIIVMDKGRIVEHGTFAELMDKKGLFYKMAGRNMA